MAVSLILFIFPGLVSYWIYFSLLNKVILIKYVEINVFATPRNKELPTLYIIMLSKLIIVRCCLNLFVVYNYAGPNELPLGANSVGKV